jgi:hypothetical protein
MEIKARRYCKKACDEHRATAFPMYKGDPAYPFLYFIYVNFILDFKIYTFIIDYTLLFTYMKEEKTNETLPVKPC